MVKRILIITTGGTIASTEGDNGLTPTMSGEALLALLPESFLSSIVAVLPLMNIDSSNMQPENWIEIAGVLKHNQNLYDGFVILHGTDTMAYSAAALSFMTLGIKQPIILTGSQVPANKDGTDALRNLSDAIYVAASDGFSGVYIVFAGRIINGCSVTKSDSFAIDAFRSVNAPDVGTINASAGELKHAYYPIRSCPENVVFRATVDTAVMMIKMYPGLDPEIFRIAAEENYKAVVLEAYGAGGVPFLRRNVLPYIERLSRKEILTVITTQCWQGAADVSIYEVGRAAQQRGAIAAGSITKEALLTKLMWAVSFSSGYEHLKKLILTNFCGEFGDIKNEEMKGL